MSSVFKWIFKTALGWLGGGPLDRILTSVDASIDNETERQNIKADVTKTYVTNQANVLVERTWLLQFLFAVPLGLYWTSILLYSMFWCQGCAYPQDWTIAALPGKFDDFSWAIISSIFLLEGVKVYGRKR